MSTTPWPDLGGGQLPGLSSGISFTKHELEAGGNKIQGQTELIDNLAGKSGKLPVPFPHFGVAGMGLQKVHEGLIHSQNDALAKARKALDSWQPALKTADENYVKADDGDGGGGFGGGGLGGGTGREQTGGGQDAGSEGEA
ncbi:hypothetical protein E1286_45755, partial [Nonomuraea terrae]